MHVGNSNILEQLVERSPNAVLVTGALGTLEVVNEMAFRMIPLAGNPLGMKPSEAIPVPEVVEAFENKEANVELEFILGRHILRLRTVDLEPNGRLLIIEDVTRSRKLEQTQREFIANVSHELRTPTTSIVGYAETMLRMQENLDEDSLFMVQTIHRNAIRLHSLFEDLLTLSRIEANDEPLELNPLTLLPLVMECIDKQQERASKNSIQINTMISDQLSVLANRDAMIHIVGNLVENAIKYSHPGGLVTVRASRRKTVILLEVIDLGIGIAPVHVERLFDRFFRVDKGRSRGVGGTGLGLAIVKQLSDRMGSRLEVRSRVGAGSIFRLELQPIDDEE